MASASAWNAGRQSPWPAVLVRVSILQAPSTVHENSGRLLLQVSREATAQATEAFKRAVEIARSQEARLLELRATKSLAQLWAENGERQRAYDLLAPVYRWFTEGFTTRDLEEAKALLDELE
jgi:predicted ATPase